MLRRTVSLPHSEVSYLEWTSDARPWGTVVLLHGGGVDSAELSWAPMGPALAKAGWRVLAPDAPGYGESPLPDWPSTQADLIRFVAEFVETLDVDRFVLGGLSMGGGMALGYGLAHPDRVAALLCCGSYGLTSRQWPGRWSVLLHKLTWLSLHSGLMRIATNLTLRSERLMRMSMANVVRLPGSDTPELLATIAAEARRPNAGVAFGQWQRSEFTWSGLRHNYSDRFAGFDRPVLLVHGERDIGVRAADARRAADQFSDAELLVVPGAAHWVTRDAPAQVNAAVIDFLARRAGEGRL